MAEVRTEWIRAVADWSRRGYLTRVAPIECVDGDALDDPDVVVAAEILRRSGLRVTWPLEVNDEIPDDDFFTVVEVVHDLISRPRWRSYHQTDQWPGIGKAI